MTLGSGEVSLWELVQAYATMARGGDVRAAASGATAGRGRANRSASRATWQLVTDMLADPHARAKSFGVGSVLRDAVSGAVKTGTSSDFRDTWTVGFTRDYTVGVWVGNFDGSAMRGVSGVTGAGPLWNRIMLHLYERRDEPPPFTAPRGFVRAPICATTGHAPATNCPAIVEEWVRPRGSRRRAAPGRAAARAIRCLARVAAARWTEPAAHRISTRRRRVRPQGSGDAIATREQQLALRAVGSGRALRWSVGGETLALDATGTAFWPLRLGTWRIEADDGALRDHVTIRVVPPPRQTNPGFTVLR